VGMHRTNVSQFLTPDDPRVLLAHRGRVRLGILPIQALMTGRSYCLQRLDKVTRYCHNLDPVTRWDRLDYCQLMPTCLVEKQCSLQMAWTPSAAIRPMLTSSSSCILSSCSQIQLHNDCFGLRDAVARTANLQRRSAGSY
jgi:hypothetical protein